MSIQYLKRRLLQSCVIGRVIPKLGQLQPFRPFVGVGVHKTAKICFQALIDALRLPVRLRVISRAHSQLSVHQSKQFPPKSAREYLISIRYDGLRQTMQFKDVVKECLSYLESSERMRQRYKMCIFRKLVHHYHDAVIRS